MAVEPCPLVSRRGGQLTRNEETAPLNGAVSVCSSRFHLVSDGHGWSRSAPSCVIGASPQRRRPESSLSSLRLPDLTKALDAGFRQLGIPRARREAIRKTQGLFACLLVIGESGSSYAVAISRVLVVSRPAAALGADKVISNRVGHVGSPMSRPARRSSQRIVTLTVFVADRPR